MLKQMILFSLFIPVISLADGLTLTNFSTKATEIDMTSNEENSLAVEVFDLLAKSGARVDTNGENKSLQSPIAIGWYSPKHDPQWEIHLQLPSSADVPFFATHTDGEKKSTAYITGSTAKQIFQMMKSLHMNYSITTDDPPAEYVSTDSRRIACRYWRNDTNCALNLK